MKTLNVTLDKVKYSTFGCCNCLFAGSECKQYDKFIPDTFKGKPTCKNYIYFD